MRAFSLIEVLISALILSVMVGGIFLVLNTGDVTFNSDIAFLDLQQQARFAIDRMIRELREATNPVIAAGGNSITFDTLTDTGVQYYRDAATNQVIREYPAGTRQVLGNYINSLSFCCLHSGVCDAECSGSNFVRAQLSAARTVKGRNFTFSLTEQARLRNE